MDCWDSLKSSSRIALDRPSAIGREGYLFFVWSFACRALSPPYALAPLQLLWDQCAGGMSLVGTDRVSVVSGEQPERLIRSWWLRCIHRILRNLGLCKLLKISCDRFLQTDECCGDMLIWWWLIFQNRGIRQQWIRCLASLFLGFSRAMLFECVVDEKHCFALKLILFLDLRFARLGWRRLNFPLSEF